MNITYLNCGKYELDIKNIIAVIDTTFAVVKRKPEKNQACMGFEPYDLCDTHAAVNKERCTGITEVIGFESRISLIFFRLSFHNCKSFCL